MDHRLGVGRSHSGRNVGVPSQAQGPTGALGGAVGGGAPSPAQLLGSYTPQGQAYASLPSPNLMSHRVPEDGQEGPLEEDAELCEGAGGKRVAFNGIHFLERGHWIR